MGCGGLKMGLKLITVCFVTPLLRKVAWLLQVSSLHLLVLVIV